ADPAAEPRRGTTRPPRRTRGPNQAGRGHRPPGVGGLALTRDGLPGRAWVFPGPTGDAPPVAQVKGGLRGWRLGPAICAGDAGLAGGARGGGGAGGGGPAIVAIPGGKLTAGPQDVGPRRGRARLGRRCWRRGARPSTASIPRPPRRPSGPASWSPPRATAG